MRNLEIKHIYRHFKGNLYYVEDIATDADTCEALVVYRAMYGDRKLWIRSLADFLSEVDHVKYPEVTQKYRFELAEQENF